MIPYGLKRKEERKKEINYNKKHKSFKRTDRWRKSRERKAEGNYEY